MAIELLLILLLLQVKHFLFDFLLQTPYQWQNKGTFLHPGGLLHAGLHGIATYLIILIFFPWQTALLWASFDSVSHYVIDYLKVNITKKHGWKADTHPEFWYFVGFDQYCHQSMYIIIILFLFGV